MGTLRSFLTKTSFALLNLLCILLLAELTLRIRSRTLFSTENFLLTLMIGSRWEEGNRVPTVYDPQLGWIHKPGTLIIGDKLRPQVTILDDGIRGNGSLATQGKMEKGQIMAVGDSFTFGYGVSDDATWPAQLQSLTGIPVLNAGVCGYGLDQTLLRAEMLTPKYQPRLLIVSFIFDDVGRTRCSRFDWAEKPYFEVKGHGLIERNIPVPPSPKNHGFSPGELLIGHSLLAYEWILHHATGFLLRDNVKLVNQDGWEIALRLIDRFQLLSSHTHVLFLVQYCRTCLKAPREPLFELLRRISERGMAVLDLGSDLDRLFQSEPDVFESYFKSHMTSPGNALVAREVKQALFEKGWLGPRQQ